MRLFPHPSPSRERQTRGPPLRGDGKAPRRELAPQVHPEGQKGPKFSTRLPPMPHQVGASHAKPAPPRWALLEPRGYLLKWLALTDGDANALAAQWPREAPPRFGIGTGLCALDGPLISVRLPVAATVDPLPPPSGKVFSPSLLVVAPGGTGAWPAGVSPSIGIGEYVRGGSLRTVETSHGVSGALYLRCTLPPVDFIRPVHTCTSSSDADDIMASAYTAAFGAIS